jgi:hypothetical protein
LQGLISLGDVIYTTTYSTVAHVNVSAGIGAYNVSYALNGYPTFYESFVFAGQLFDITDDPALRLRKLPGDCPNSSNVCYSYYFPGGLGAIFPTANAIEQNADVIIAPNIQGFQIDFWDVPVSQIPSPGYTDCPVYAGSGDAFQVCIAPLSDNNTCAISLTPSFQD